MGKKMKFPFLSNAMNNIVQHPKSSWQWLPSCHQPRILSFRINNINNKTLFTTIINSTYLDPIDETPDHNPPLEVVIRGLKSDRLFFEPGQTSSIMEEATKSNEQEEEEKEDDNDYIDVLPFKESVALLMESRDPYVDFREYMF
ncbi:ovate family protein 13, ARABIDOPSIS THALIANA OVATE FAMILY PROTEIN 13 [Hibiscus trionum]|uniref:Ovate family protein 13, ARABIDOPSIS THALIANA OVATE FAMILY PROTEIN 13 n=1 Tax=Hibiscus trionum TaxID=183268 RepID=A0A9W7J5S8_HIBTR|nr:ovate family protein 13, ARABIDOPSIS THALIANA OVATE FAMILY PROTEIN 13 [Hibiscus trionum]